MDWKTGKPDHIEDALVQIHKKQWFTWTDSSNKIYANLRLTEKIGVGGELIDNPVTELPTEKEVNDKLKELQDIWNENNKEYKLKRKAEYPDIYDYMDGIVKNDQTQIDKYIADAQAVKAKYSKGA
tara:strand:- start:37 stop:414 length:378 start_codon:yes stop_codon:yes gene_type:complete